MILVMLYHFVILLLSAKKLNHVRVSIDHRLVHYILANPKAKMTINNNSQFTSLRVMSGKYKFNQGGIKFKYLLDY